MSNFVRKFYIADTHFGHEAIIRYCNRPFVSVVEMDAYMIDQWNAVVMDTDIVYHSSQKWPSKKRRRTLLFRGRE